MLAVTMTVTVYRSTDASAPALNGTAGSLCTVLDAILVNGYGAKAAAGWAIAYTGTNKRIYRAPTGALRPYLRVQDDAPRAAPYNDATECRISGSEGASAVDTQTNRFPISTTSVFFRKSRSADSTARPWVAVADERTIYFFAQSGDFFGYSSFMFGEYYSLKSGTDAYNGLLIGGNVEQITATPLPVGTNDNLHKLSTLTNTTAGHFVARPASEIAQHTAVSTILGKHGNAAHSASDLTGLMMYPNYVDSGLYLSQVWLHEPTAVHPVIRGRMRGFWHLLHPSSVLRDGDTWTGTGALSGKSFLAIGPTSNGAGMFVMETSNTWETN